MSSARHLNPKSFLLCLLELCFKQFSIKYSKKVGVVRECDDDDVPVCKVAFPLSSSFRHSGLLYIAQ